MIVGITASRNLTAERHEWQVLKALQPYLLTCSRLAHGACVGGDEIAARIARRSSVFVVAFVPPYRRLVSAEAISNSRAVFNIERGPDGYKRRNQALVDYVDILVAFPEYGEHDHRSIRSGTWQTVRMGRRKSIPVHVFQLEP